jgi:hypothetical protein
MAYGKNLEMPEFPSGNIYTPVMILQTTSSETDDQICPVNIVSTGKR